MNFKPRWTHAVALAAVLAACGVGDRNVELKQDQDKDAGTSNEAGVQGTGGKHPGSGGTFGGGDGGGGGMPAGLDGGASSKCDPACSGDTPVCDDGSCVQCMTGSGRCAADDVPEICEDSMWVKKAACGGSTPVCSKGKCSPVRLSGAIVTVGDAVLSTTKIRLVNHGLEYAPRTCGTVKGSDVCVTGGLQP